MHRPARQLSSSESWACTGRGAGREEPPARVVRSDGANVLGFLALATGADVELDGLTLGQRRTRGLKVRDMNKHVLASLPRDETESSVVIEELHFALHCVTNLSLLADPNGRPTVDGTGCGRAILVAPASRWCGRQPGSPGPVLVESQLQPWKSASHRLDDRNDLVAVLRWLDVSTELRLGARVAGRSAMDQSLLSDVARRISDEFDAERVVRPGRLGAQS